MTLILNKHGKSKVQSVSVADVNIVFYQIFVCNENAINHENAAANKYNFCVNIGQD